MEGILQNVHFKTVGTEVKKDCDQDMCTEDEHISRLDEVLNKLQELDKYSEHLSYKAYTVKAKLIGDNPVEDRYINEKTDDDSKLTRVENYIDSIGINLDKISEELRLLDNAI